MAHPVSPTEQQRQDPAVGTRGVGLQIHLLGISAHSS